MERAVKFAERIQEKLEKYKENNERDKKLSKIFKEVEAQKRNIHKAQRDMLSKKEEGVAGPSFDNSGTQ